MSGLAAGYKGWIVALAVLALAACGAIPRQEEAMAEEAPFTDFAALRTADSPNNWLIAPSGFGPARADETAPVFDAPAERVAAIWTRIVEEQPRARVLAVSPDGLRIEAEQKSAVFGFTDRISAQILPVDAARSTIIAYSRARVGYWDLGVNRRRLETWVSLLRERTEGG